MNKLLKKYYLMMIVQEGFVTLVAIEHVKPILSPQLLSLLAVERIELGRVSLNRAEIIDEESVFYTMSAFAQNYKFCAAAVITSSPDVIIKFLPVPKMRRSEYRKFLISGFRDIFPVKLDDYVCDCKITGSQAFTAAIPKKVTESYVRLFTRLGISLVKADIYENIICEYTGFIDRESHLTAFESYSDYIFIHVSSGIARDICRIHSLKKNFMGIGKLAAFLSNLSVKKIYFIDFNCDELTSFFAENCIEAVQLTNLATSLEFYEKVFISMMQS